MGEEGGGGGGEGAACAGAGACPNLPSSLSSPQFAEGTCRYGDACTYAHGAHELREAGESAAADCVAAAAGASGLPTSRICFRWATAGSCVYGARCNFEHLLPPGGAGVAGPVAAAVPAAVAAVQAHPPAPPASPRPPPRPVGGGAAIIAARARAACAALGVGGAARAGVPPAAVAALADALRSGDAILAGSPWADDVRACMQQP